MILIIASLVLYTIMLILAIYGAGKFKSLNSLLKKLGFRETRVVNAILQGLFYLGILIVTSIVIGGIFYYFDQGDVEKVSEAIQGVEFAQILIVLSVASFVEEIFFRGYLQRKTNLLIATFIFAYFHIVYGSLAEVVGAFFLGLVLGICFIRTKNLFIPIFAHFSYNLITVVLNVI